LKDSRLGVQSLRVDPVPPSPARGEAWVRLHAAGIGERQTRFALDLIVTKRAGLRRKPLELRGGGDLQRWDVFSNRSLRVAASRRDESIPLDRHGAARASR
jgi:hypothetical protein